MKAYRLMSALLAVLVSVIGLSLLVHRGGLIAWCAFLGGSVILLKLLFKPAANELKLALGLGGAALFIWLLSYVLVISLWESGEVVELSVDTRDGVQELRLWVLEIDGQLTIYHDAAPGVAESLLSARPVRLIHRGRASTRIPVTQRVEEINEEQATKIYQAMEEKYGYRNLAALVYYGLLGLPRDRVAVIATLQ